MAREGVTYTAASTPFLSDICDAVKAGAARPKSLRSFLCGGPPIPSVLIERAADELGLKVCSLWGMTEVLSGTLTEPVRAAEKSASTDGRSLEGMEVRIADLEGAVYFNGQNATATTNTFQLNQISAGATTQIGLITVATDGTAAFSGSGGELAVGDVLQLYYPSTTGDPTLGDVGITVITERM